MSGDNWDREILEVREKILGQSEPGLARPFLNLADDFESTMSKLLKDSIAGKQVRLGDKWRDQLNRELDDMRKQVPDASKMSAEVSEAGLAFLAGRTRETGAMIRSLANLAPVGTYAEKIVRMTVAFEEKSEELEDIWDELADDMQDMDEDLDEIIKDVRETVDKAVEASADRHKTLYEYGLKIAEYIRKAPDDINPATLLGQFSIFAKWAAQLADTPTAVVVAKRKLWERCGKIEAELGKRGVGIVMFGEVRQTTEEFLKAVNIDESAKCVKAVKDCVKMSVAGGATPGQKSDLEALGKALIDAVEDAHDKLCSAHDRFVSAHRGAFFGGVSTKTFATIMNDDRFKRPLGEIRISRWNDALRRLYDMEYVPLLLKHYQGTQKQVLKEYLTDEFDKLFKKIEKEAEELEKLDAELDEFIESLGELREKVG